MSRSDMKKLIEQMQHVREPGLYNASASGVANTISRDGNGTHKAIEMYNKMMNVGVQQQELKEDVKKVGTFETTDQLKLLGAIQAIKELLEDVTPKKENCASIFERIKKITDCFN